MHTARVALAALGLALASRSAAGPPAPRTLASDAAGLVPGEHRSPLVRLQRLQGVEDHLHIDEVRLCGDDLLAQASYTFGLVDVRDHAAMEYLSQDLRHALPGDRRRPGAIHLACDRDRVYTTHRGNLRNPAFLSGWDVRDPRAPRQLPVLQEEGVSYEGVDVARGHVFVALHGDGLGVYRPRPDGGLQPVARLAGFENAWGVAARGATVYVADGPGGLVTVDVTTPAAPRIRGRARTGGWATGVAVDGDVAYVAAGAAGLVTVDVAEAVAPRVLAQVPTPGPAVRVDVSEGHALVAAWRDARVYDVSRPAAPRFVGAVRLTQRDDDIADGDRPASTSRVLGVAARGRDLFVGNWHVLYSYRLHPERLAPSLRLPERAAHVDLGRVATGTRRVEALEVTNQGTAPLTLLRAWVDGEGFSVRPRQARVAPGETLALEVTFEARDAAPRKGYLQLLSDDPLQPRRTAYLVANELGLGVGSLLPETRALTLDGGQWSSGEAEGKVLLLSYFATF